MAKFEQIVNDARSSLSNTIDSGQVTLIVDNPVRFPSDGNFRIILETEVLLVTAISGSIFTVTRGAEGTTPAAHNAGVDVNSIITSASLKQRTADFIPLSTDEIIQNGNIQDSTGALAKAVDFTFFNQGGTTLVDLVNGSLRLESPVQTTLQLRGGRLIAPGTPYGVIMKFAASYYGDDGANNRQPSYGLHLAENATGKIVAIQFVNHSQIGVQKYTSPSAFDSDAVAEIDWLHNPVETFLRVRDNGTTIFFDTSQTGLYWTSIFSEARATFFTTAPDRVGFHINPQFDKDDAPAVPAVPNWNMSILHWSFE